MNKKFFGLFLSLIITFLLISACNNKIEFTVNFEVDGVVYKTVSTRGNGSISMPVDPEKEGYIFEGWYWDEDEWLIPFTADSILDTPLSSNMSIYLFGLPPIFSPI